MKKFIVAAVCLLSLAAAASAQQKPQINFPEYEFTTVVANPITPVGNQYRSGTCWAYSTMGFVESEIIRINNITDPEKYPQLSVFFTVSHAYSDRASKYVMLDGNLTFGAGSEADDVLHVIEDYGIVPLSEMSGMNYGTELPIQGEMDAVLKSYVQAVAKNPNRTLSTAWKRGFDAVLAEYLGEYPQTFEVNGREFTPETYRDYLNFVPADYITLTSFTHHPFYKHFAIEVCDNWRWDEAYNVPIDEMMNILDEAIQNGYTAAWGADVSEPGFTRDGLAILVDVQATQNAGSDQAHWVGEGEEKEVVNNIVEREASQEQRQKDFENKTLTDDHGMVIFGIAKDQWGGKYYMIKNSWGTNSKYEGIWYASEAFVKAQTIDIVLHKSALPQDFVSDHKNIR